MDKARLSELLTQAIKRGASDIHLSVGHPPHYRLKGDLLPAAGEPTMTPQEVLAIARILLDDESWKPEIRERDFSHSIPGIGRFRVHLFSQRGSVGLVIRVIPYEVRNFEASGLPPVLSEIAAAKRGLVLVTGSTGCGKSTTMAAMIRQISESRVAHVVTIEDPIEYLFGQSKCIVTQRELGSDTRDYRGALVSALRQDPDVVMVGEIADAETAEICLKAAENGVLVIGAIHTPNVVSTLSQLIGFFPASARRAIRVRLADSLTAVISMRLLVSKSGMGLLPAVEILRGTRNVREYLRRDDDFHDVVRAMESGGELYGMQSFDQHLAKLCADGAIKVEVAKMAATHGDTFEKYLEKASGVTSA